MKRRTLLAAPVLGATAAATPALGQHRGRLPEATVAARLRNFGPENVDLRTGALLQDRVVLSWLSNSAFAAAGASPNQLSSYATSGPADRPADVLLRGPVPEFGLCLMRDLRTRTACVRVEIAPDGTATSAPIAADDPLVAKTVNYTHEVLPDPPDNYCGTCVAFR